MLPTEQSDEQRKQIHCNVCARHTNHVLCGEHTRHANVIENKEWIYGEDFVYRMWVCAGCDTATLEEEYHCSLYDALTNPEKHYYPQRELDHLRVKSYMRLPKNLAGTYRECVLSFNAGLRLLCAAGLRALIEGICKSHAIGGKNLEVKIDGLNKLLPEHIVKSIHSFRFMGNEAVHELKPPEKKDLELAIEVCEDLMNYIYELDYKAKQLPQKEAATLPRNRSE